MKPTLRIPSLAELNARERLLAAGSAIVLLVVILDRLVLSPWLRQGQAVRQEIRRLEGALQHHRQLLAREARVVAQMEAYQKYLRPMLADELQVAALLKEVEEISRQADIALLETKPLAVEADPLMKRYPLDVQFECTLEAWVDFVIQLESSPSLFQIVRASLSVEEEMPDRLRGSMRVVGTAMRPKDAAPPNG
jgi:Tfp pilus assembly protein PilO